MASKALAMNKIREILRYKLLLGRSHRQTARGLGVSTGKVAEVSLRAKRLGLDWAGVQALDDVELDAQIHRARTRRGRSRPLPDPAQIHKELRKKGVTLELLHLEYLQEHPDGYRYTSFCSHYKKWLATQSPVMRQVHRAGDKAFVDYAGHKAHIVDRRTGEVTEVELFVGVLGASNLTYAEATLTQKIEDFTQSHVRMFCYFGGVPRAVVPDQLRSAVRSADRYEPLVSRSYEDLARHYGMAVLPARPGKPRDKAKVEVCASARSIEVFYQGKRVAMHPRSHRVGMHSTISEHMPKAHRAHAQWSPSRIIRWGASIGPNTEALVRAILDERPHPEMGYRSCLGILRLSKRYGSERLEAACARGLWSGARSYRHIDSILKHGLDRIELGEDEERKDEQGSDKQTQETITHANVRGSNYYH